MKRKSHRANNPVSILDTVVYDGDNPIGMKDGSMAAGTDRLPVEGGALVGNGSMYIDIGDTNVGILDVPNFRFSCLFSTTNPNVRQDIYSTYGGINTNSGVIIRLNSDGIINIRSGDENSFYNEAFRTLPTVIGNVSYLLEVIKVGGVISVTLNENIGVSNDVFPANVVNEYLSLLSTKGIGNEFQGSVSNIKYDELDSQGNFVQNLLHYKTQESEGNTVYDSSGNGNHGTIINPYAEQWGTQNVISYADDEGYSKGGNLLKYSGDLVTTGWSYLNVSVSGGELDIDGESNAFRITSTNSNLAEHALRQITTHSGNKWETSILVKIGSGLDAVYIRDTYSTAFASFNLTTGTVFLEIGASATIEDKGNGWYKISVIALEDTTSFDSINFGLGQNTSSAVPLGEYVIVCRPQSKIVGSNYEYITTEASSITDVILSKDNSITLPPFKDVLGNDLQYQGLCPSRAKFVESSCFTRDADIGGVVFDTPITVNTLTDDYKFAFYRDGRTASAEDWVLGGSAVMLRFNSAPIVAGVSGDFTALNWNSTPEYNNGKFTVEKIGTDVTVTIEYDGGIVSETKTAATETVINLQVIGNRNTTASSISTGNLYDFYIEVNGVSRGYWPLSEPIIDPANHTYHDISGNGNHATLVNGSVANEGTQDVFHWGQNGLSKYFLGDTTSRVKLDVQKTFSSNDRTLVIDYFDTQGTCCKAFTSMCQYLNVNNGKVVLFDGSSYKDDGNLYNDGVSHQIRMKQDITTGITKLGVDANPEIDVNVVPGTGGIISAPLLYIGTGPGGSFRTTDVGIYRVRVYDQDIPYTDSLDLYIPSYEWTTSNTDYVVEDTASGLEVDRAIISIPASSALDGTDALGNPLTLPQDGKSFLNTGTKLQHYPMARVVQADDNIRPYYVTSSLDQVNFPNLGNWQIGDTLELTVNSYNTGRFSILRVGQGYLNVASDNILSISGNFSRIGNGTVPFSFTNGKIRIVCTNTGASLELRTYFNDILKTYGSPSTGVLDTDISIGQTYASIIGSKISVRDFKFTRGGKVILNCTMTKGSNFIDTVGGNNGTPVGTIDYDDGFFFDKTGLQLDKLTTDFDGAISNQSFSDVSKIDIVSNIRTHKSALTRKQLDTELKITNNG